MRHAAPLQACASAARARGWHSSRQAAGNAHSQRCGVPIWQSAARQRSTLRTACTHTTGSRAPPRSCLQRPVDHCNALHGCSPARTARLALSHHTHKPTHPHTSHSAHCSTCVVAYHAAHANQHRPQPRGQGPQRPLGMLPLPLAWLLLPWLLLACSLLLCSTCCWSW